MAKNCRPKMYCNLKELQGTSKLFFMVGSLNWMMMMMMMMMMMIFTNWKWLEITISIHEKLVGFRVPGDSVDLVMKWL